MNDAYAFDQVWTGPVCLPSAGGVAEVGLGDDGIHGPAGVTVPGERWKAAGKTATWSWPETDSSNASPGGRESSFSSPTRNWA